MPFTEPTAAPPSSPPNYSPPSHSDLAAVAATVSVVGVLMAVLLTWLVLRLRRASRSQSQSILVPSRPASAASYAFRPSLAPSEASSKFGFIRNSRSREDASWDFADPDPFAHAKERPSDPTMCSSEHRPAPPSLAPAYTPRAQRSSTYKVDLSANPRASTTPGTPASVDLVEPPPPAYCPEGAAPWPSYEHKVLPA